MFSLNGLVCNLIKMTGDAGMLTIRDIAGDGECESFYLGVKAPEKN